MLGRKFLRLVVLSTLTLTMVIPPGSVLASDEGSDPGAGPPSPQAACTATGDETVATDKADYAPGETVQISGTGYAPDCDVVVHVTRPDGSVVVGDGSFAPGSDTVATDSAGNLAYSYQLNGIEGEYLVEVLGAGDAVLTTTTFTDAIPLGGPGLFEDAGGTIPKRAFERGDTIRSFLRNHGGRHRQQVQVQPHPAGRDGPARL